MQYRRLGNAGMKVSTVALGGWTTFGGSIKELALAEEIIVGAYEAGINHMMRRQRVEAELLPVTEPLGIGLTSFSPLANGLLSGKYDDGLPEGTRYAARDNLGDAFEVNRDRVRQLKPIADELGISRAELALAWCLRLPGVSSVITGATKQSQIESNARAADVEFSEDIVAQIDQIMPL